jgi:hypothetical protein
MIVGNTINENFKRHLCLCWNSDLISGGCEFEWYTPYKLELRLPKTKGEKQIPVMRSDLIMIDS